MTQARRIMGRVAAAFHAQSVNEEAPAMPYPLPATPTALRITTRIAGIASLLVVASIAHAGPCAVVSMGKPAQVVVDGRSAIVRTGMRIEQCAGRLRVAEGQAMLVYTRTSGQTEHTVLSAGQEIDLDRLGTRDGASETFGRLMAFVGTNNRVEAVAAARRGDQVPGFPYGAVAPDVANAAILVADDTARVIRMLRVHPRGKPEAALIAVDADAVTVPLPRGRLAPGEYEWNATLSDGQQYAGSFAVVPADVTARVGQRLQAIERDAALTPQARELLRAAIYDDNGLAWQRETAYRALGAARR